MGYLGLSNHEDREVYHHDAAGTSMIDPYYTQCV